MALNGARGTVALLHNYRERGQPSMMIYAGELGEALAQQGWRVERVRPPDLLPPTLQRVPFVSKIDSLAGRYVAYPRALRRVAGDLFHVIDHGQGHLVRHLDPARTVVTCHDIILLVVAAGRLRSPERPPLATRLLRGALRAMKRARRVIADSEQTRRDLCSLADFDIALIRVIPPGLDRAFHQVPGAREGFRVHRGLGSGPLVLHVGNASFYKNVPGVLRTFAAVRKSGVDAVLLRVGPELPADLRAQAHRLGITPHLVELGALPRSELVRAYNAADVLLFPSLYEGFGWPPLEAMACGTPVVCSRGGSLAEVAAPAALTAEAEDVDGLARLVLTVLTVAAERERLVARGLEHSARFDWADTARRVGQVYEEVLS